MPINLPTNPVDGQVEYLNEVRFTYDATQDKWVGISGNALVSDNYITTNMIINGAVTNDKIAADTITSDRFNNLNTVKVKDVNGTDVITIYTPGA